MVHPDRVLHPCIVHCLRLHHVTAVAAAHHHTLFLTDAGQVAPLAASFACPMCWKLGNIGIPAFGVNRVLETMLCFLYDAVLVSCCAWASPPFTLRVLRKPRL